VVEWGGDNIEGKNVGGEKSLKKERSFMTREKRAGPKYTGIQATKGKVLEKKKKKITKEKCYLSKGSDNISRNKNFEKSTPLCIEVDRGKWGGKHRQKRKCRTKNSSKGEKEKKTNSGKKI